MSLSGARASDPIGIYVHFPFCRARCHYCAFYFVVGRSELHASYLEAVDSELDQGLDDPRFAGRAVHSVYFGGGTPSTMDPKWMRAFLAHVRERCDVVEDVEISVEANPDGLTADGLAAFREAGCNRLTLGWQSLDGGNLRLLTRTHDPEDNLKSLELAREAAFENVGVDMIFGVPGQTPKGWRSEIEEVARLSPEHVSAYELTMEEGTRFFERHRARKLSLPDDDGRARMFEETEDVLGPAGIFRYEISNFAKVGRECRHNVSGWTSGDLLGLGASAASHVANVRWTNVADVELYVQRVREGPSPAEPPELLDDGSWAAEDLYLGLRLTEGIDAGARIESLAPPAAERLRATLADAEENGLLERVGPRVRLTRRGLLLADCVFEALLSA
jgi:oxygen-independent coproporphyrinogen-3 oxidase